MPCVAKRSATSLTAQRISMERLYKQYETRMNLSELGASATDSIMQSQFYPITMSSSRSEDECLPLQRQLVHFDKVFRYEPV